MLPAAAAAVRAQCGATAAGRAQDRPQLCRRRLSTAVRHADCSLVSLTPGAILVAPDQAAMAPVPGSQETRLALVQEHKGLQGAAMLLHVSTT